MTLSPEAVLRYRRQILLAPIGGDGQERILRGSVLLHGTAPLTARYLAAAGLGRLLVSGAFPPLGATDPSFRLLEGRPGDPADVVLDLGDGDAWRNASGRRIWGGASGARVLLGVEPVACAPPEGAARAVLETLGAGEALRALLGLEPKPYDFSA